jgi:hypothetical protein
MHASAFLAILLALLLPAVSFAAEDKPVQKTEPGTHVGMPFLIAPVTIDGTLAGYSYINSKLVAATPSASVAIREKLAFIQDAFVHDVNAAPVGKASDLRDVDTAALAARLVADARRIVGAKNVVSIVFTQIQFSPIHPKQSTEDAIPPSERPQLPQPVQTPLAQNPSQQAAAAKL